MTDHFAENDAAPHRHFYRVSGHSFAALAWLMRCPCGAWELLTSAPFRAQRQINIAHEKLVRVIPPAGEV